MERFIMDDLVRWKNRNDRKPLILLGARQVGKTYILKEFGRREYENVAYINCDNNALVRDLFTPDYNIGRILLTIGAITGVNIQPGKTLIIMDEVQELKRGLASLKYFCEDAPQYHVAVAGSLLGLTLHDGDSYPVGKVNTLNMYPMTFEEFLLARKLGEGSAERDTCSLREGYFKTRTCRAGDAHRAGVAFHSFATC